MNEQDKISTVIKKQNTKQTLLNKLIKQKKKNFEIGIEN